MFINSEFFKFIFVSFLFSCMITSFSISSVVFIGDVVEYAKKLSSYSDNNVKLLIQLAALNLPKGCKVITPACTFSTTLAPIIQLGYKPLFVDVNLTSYVPDIKDIIAKSNKNNL